MVVLGFEVEIERERRRKDEGRNDYID